MLSAKETSEKINNVLDEIIREAQQRCKTGKALRANYKTGELESYINKVNEVKDSFNDHWWIPND